MVTSVFFLPYFILVWMMNLSDALGISNSPPSLIGKGYYTEIPFRVERDKILVTIKVGNADRTFLLDTGAPFMVDAALVDEMGYRAVGSKNLKDATGNRTQVQTIHVPELVLGDIHFSNQKALMYDFRKGLMGCFEIDGIIGSNLLSRSVIQFDWKAGKLIITDSARRLGKESRKAIKIRVNKKQSSPFVPVRMSDGIRVWSLLDTGSDDFFSMSLEDLKAIQKKGRLMGPPLSQSSGSSNLGLMGGQENAYEMLIDVGKLGLDQVQILENAVIETNLDNDSRVGMKLLERGVLTLDYRKKRVWFELYPELPDYQYSNFGFGFVPKEGHWIIKEVWEGSDAERLGIAIGDTLLQFGQVNVAVESVCDVLFKLPAEKDGDSLQVRVKHVSPGQEERYTLKKKVY